MGSKYLCPLGTSSLTGASAIAQCQKSCLLFPTTPCIVVNSLNPFSLNQSNIITIPSFATLYLKFDFSNISAVMLYNLHYQIGIYQNVSADSTVAAQLQENLSPGQTLDLETINNTPLAFPYYFTSNLSDPHKNFSFTLSVYSQVQQSVRIQVEITNGYYSGEAPKFLNCVTHYIDQATRADLDSGEDAQFFAILMLSDMLTNNIVMPLNVPNAQEYNTSLLINVVEAPDLDAWQLANVGRTARDIGYFSDPSVGGSVARSFLYLPYLPFFSGCKDYDDNLFIAALLEVQRVFPFGSLITFSFEG